MTVVGAQLSDVHLDKNGNTGTSASTENGNPVTQNNDNQSNISRETTESAQKGNAETNIKERENKEIFGKGEEGLTGGEVKKEGEDIGNRKRKKGEEDEENNRGKSKETRKEDTKDEGKIEKDEKSRKQQETHGGDGNERRGGSREKTRRENENEVSQGDEIKKEEDRGVGEIMGTGDLGYGGYRERTEGGHGKRTIFDSNFRSSAEGANNPSENTIENKEFPVSLFEKKNIRINKMLKVQRKLVNILIISMTVKQKRSKLFMYFHLKPKGIEIIMLYIWYLINVDFKFEL